MNKPKRLRRRCAAEDCRKVFRHADQRAAFCSLACKQRVYRARKKAAAQVAQEQVEAERHEQAQAMATRMQARTQADMDSRPRQPGACTTPPRGPTSTRANTLAIPPTYRDRSPSPRW